MQSKDQNFDKEANALSKALVIVRPIYTYTLFGFCIASIVLVYWGLFGSIPQKIRGLGEITTEEGVARVNSLFSGQIANVNVNVNDVVNEGDILFELNLPELEDQIHELQQNIELLSSKNNLIRFGNSKSTDLKSLNDQLGLEVLQSQKAELEKSIRFLEDKVTYRKNLYDDGLITYSEYFDTQKELESTKTAIVDLEKQISSIELNTSEWLLGKKISETELKNQIEILNRELQDLEEELEIKTKIRSKSEGVVVQVSAKKGDIISSEIQLATISEQENSMDYIMNLFIPFNSNEPIIPEMKVDIELFTVDRNNYGWLKGTVQEVNRFVSSSQSLFNEVQNEELVGLLESQGPVYNVKVKLNRNNSTTSGFEWTNKSGPPYKIVPGQLGLGYVHVKEKAPIDFLIPFFKEYFD